LLDLVAQAIFHSFIAALTVEALLRLWGVDDGPTRYAFRLLSLLLPLVAIPLFHLLAPERTSELFREQLALFAGRRWADVRLFGVDLYRAWLVVFAGLGVLLFLRDLVPVLRDLGGRPRAEARVAPDLRVSRLVLELAAKIGVVPPPVVMVDRRTPVLLCSGALAPRLVVSAATLEHLDDEELTAAVAHELAHVRHRDPLVGWLLMGTRALMFFNPVFQVVARLVAREAEWRADADAVATTSLPLPLAAGILKLYRAAMPPLRGPRPGWLPSLDGPLARATTAAVTRRCRRLLEGLGTPVPFRRTRLTLTALSLSTLLFFVV
jgi:Zn-dependent protease with chaperone function